MLILFSRTICRKNPSLGSANTAYKRHLKPAYEDGVSSPRGWTENRTINGFYLPEVILAFQSKKIICVYVYIVIQTLLRHAKKRHQIILKAWISKGQSGQSLYC